MNKRRQAFGTQPTVASEESKAFKVDQCVSFAIKEEKQFGHIVKLLGHSAVVTIYSSDTNKDLVYQSSGVTVVNYKDLKSEE